MRMLYDVFRATICPNVLAGLPTGALNVLRHAVFVLLLRLGLKVSGSTAVHAWRSTEECGPAASANTGNKQLTVPFDSCGMAFWINVPAFHWISCSVVTASK
jgi:hypothetical protein